MGGGQVVVPAYAAFLAWSTWRGFKMPGQGAGEVGEEVVEGPTSKRGVKQARKAEKQGQVRYR